MQGLRANLLRMYNTISEEGFAQCKSQHKYQKLLFSLTYFHSVLLERRKFRTLGLNIPYDFNDTDFGVSDDLLKTYLDSYEQTPWDALKYLIAGAERRGGGGGTCFAVPGAGCLKVGRWHVRVRVFLVPTHHHTACLPRQVRCDVSNPGPAQVVETALSVGRLVVPMVVVVGG